MKLILISRGDIRIAEPKNGAPIKLSVHEVGFMLLHFSLSKWEILRESALLAKKEDR